MFTGFGYGRATLLLPGLFAVPVQRTATKDEEGASDDLRLAQSDDPFVRSPVHAMHEALSRLDESPDQPQVPGSSDSHDAGTPGWVRLAAPVILSALLWAAIYVFVSRLITSVM